ncbi:MAG: TolC family protein [Thiobacillaceae bacterium]
MNLPALAEGLAEALQRAWSRHPQALADPALEAAALARAELAAALTPGPAAVSLDHLSDGAGSDRGKREWQVEFAIPLWLPKLRSAREAEARAALDELHAMRHALRLKLAGELREAWWTIAAARQALDLSQRRLASARALEADVARRYLAGDLARTDANLARNERMAAEAEVIDANAALTRAEQAWQVLTGTPPPLNLAPETAPAADSDAEHPRLAALMAAMRLAQARVRVAEESRRDSPELALRVVRERSDVHDPYGYSLGVKFTLPLAADTRTTQDSASARAAYVMAEAEANQARLILAQDLARARRELDAVEAQLTLARERKALIDENLKLAEKAFALGETDLHTLLRVRALAMETEANLGRLQISRGAAHSRLLQALGFCHDPHDRHDTGPLRARMGA